MNLTQPPFDDVHVRRAMNWIIDKAALRQAWGGPLLGAIAAPHRPRLDLRQRARRLRPVRGRRATAAASRRRSRRCAARSTTSPHDGTCSADACHDVLLLDDTRTPAYLKLLPVVEADAKKIGITFHVLADRRRAPAPSGRRRRTSRSRSSPAWAKDYPDAVTFLSPLFDGRTIIPVGNANASLVGLRAVAGEEARPHREHGRHPERRRRPRPLRRARRTGRVARATSGSTGS